ncbi:MAG: DUF1896 family protein [Alistipes sp.]
METHDEMWFCERLQQFLRERHPQRSIHTGAIDRRSRLAAESYAAGMMCSDNPTQALRDADRILFRGLLFSPYDVVHLILETDFPAIPENKRRDVALRLLPVCRPVFLIYNLGDDFAEKQEFKELKADLRTCICFWIDENGVPGYQSGAREPKAEPHVPYSRQPKYKKHKRQR